MGCAGTGAWADVKPESCVLEIGELKQKWRYASLWKLVITERTKCAT